MDIKLLAISKGSSIVVMDMSEKEVGRGRYKGQYTCREGNYTAYECMDKTIKVQGDHIINIDGVHYKVSFL